MDAKLTRAHYLHLNYLDAQQRAEELDRSQFVFKFNKFLVVLFGGYICNFDLVGAKPIKPNAEPPHWARRTRFKLRFGWVSKLVLVVSAVACCYVLRSVADLYSNQYCRLRLTRLRQLMHGQLQAPGGGALNSTSMRAQELELIERLNDISSRLVIKGSVMAKFGMLVECMIVFLCSLVFYLHVVPRFIYAFVTPFDFHTIRDLLEPECERRRVEAVCRRQVDRFVQSSRQLLAQNCGPGAAWPMGDSRACHLAAKMLEQGALMPMNKSASWIERRNRIQFWLHTYHVLYCVALNWATVSWARSVYMDADSGQLPTSWSSLLFELGALYLSFVAASTGSFLSPVLFVYSRDMIKSIESVRRLVHDCIAMNDREMARYEQLLNQQPVGRDRDRDRRAAQQLMHQAGDCMNANYLFVLLSFKVLMVQVRDFKRSLGPAAPVAYVLALLMPIFVRLHVPYFAGAKLIDGQQFRWLALLCSVTILIASDGLLLPIGYAHSRCLHLYRAMASLMAQIGRVHLAEPDLFDACSVASLRKELLKPDYFIDQFAIGSLGVSVTFTTLVKFHFWWSVAALSIVVDGEPTSFGALFRDPFGFFTF